MTPVVQVVSMLRHTEQMDLVQRPWINAKTTKAKIGVRMAGTVDMTRILRTVIANLVIQATVAKQLKTIVTPILV